MANIEHYKGREQAFIKHSLLTAYLARLFMIIGQSEKKIRYVDCFAGPWQEGSDDLKDTSIFISLDIMKRCHEGLMKRGKNVQFKALYIEKNKRAFNKLKSFLEKEASEQVVAQCEHGEFFSLRNDILKWCGENDFVFFFIDPTGWKEIIEIETLSPLLQRPHSEFLINFMFDFLLRVHSQPVFEEQMKMIFGEVPNTIGMEPKQRESHLIKLYLFGLKNALARRGKLSRSAYVKVLDPLKNRTKYDLVYLTRHPRGVVVFMEESEKLDLIQKRVRARIKQEHRIEKSGQHELFKDTNIIGDNRVDLDKVKGYWLSKLSYKPKRFGIEELADMHEETGWFKGYFQKAFNELLSEGKVLNIAATRRRPIHAVHFEKGEYLKKIKL